MENFDQLFHLIHSLSKSEKRYFKIYSAIQAGNKLYIKLFDLIDKQKQYDEKELKSKLKTTAFPPTKVYLYNLILKSLRLQEQHDNKKKSVQDLLENAQALLRKGLYIQSYKQLIKAKKIAMKFEQLPQLIEIYQMEHAIANASGHLDILEKLYDGSNKEFHFVISALQEQFEYRKGINLISYKSIQAGKMLRSKKEKEEIENKIAHLLNKNPSECLSYKAKIFHYNVGELYNYANNNFQEAYNQSYKAICHFESDFDMLNQEMSNYINSMSNIMNSLMKMKKYREMMSLINKMKQLPIESLREKVRVFAFSASRQIVYYTATDQYQKGAEFISELEKQISTYQDKLKRQGFYALCGNITEFYFVFGNFKKALHWNNKILHHPEIKLYQHWYTNARIAEIIIHYELNNVDACESLIKSHALFLKKGKYKGKFETIFLMNFKQLAKTDDSQKRKKIYPHFLNQIRELSSISYETEVFDILDIQSWLQSKIDGKSFSDIVINKL